MGRVLRAERGGRRAGTAAAQGTREMADEHCPGSADRGGRGSGGGSTHGAGGGQTLARNRRLPGDAEMWENPTESVKKREKPQETSQNGITVFAMIQKWSGGNHNDYQSLHRLKPYTHTSRQGLL
ncbi:hypothetical protein RB195_026067 [Necator americanus]|uniref:Uncharacterized protein n=1 Tax=Necator americanus TaxID=51031 RepID=A0ABR1EVB7_NECAM